MESGVINYVGGLGVRMPDQQIHACKDVEMTMCGVQIPDDRHQAHIAPRAKIQCQRCIDMMAEEAH